MGEIRVYLPEELHKRLKAHTSEKGITIRDAVIKALHSYLKGEKSWP